MAPPKKHSVKAFLGRRRGVHTKAFRETTSQAAETRHLKGQAKTALERDQEKAVLNGSTLPNERQRLKRITILRRAEKDLNALARWHKYRARRLREKGRKISQKKAKEK